MGLSYITSKTHIAIKQLLAAVVIIQMFSFYSLAAEYTCTQAAKDSAYHLMEKACLDDAKKGDERAQATIGLMYLQNLLGAPLDANKGFYWTKKAAENGHINAQFMLGMLYKDGIGTKKDEELSQYWLIKSAKKNNMMAEAQLARKYILKHDIERTFYWMKRSADHGFDRAQLFMGMAFNEGFFGKIDKNKAALWYAKAAEQGNEIAKEWIDNN